MLSRPARPSVFLKKLNKTVYVNFISIADEEWINERYPNGQIEKDMAAQKCEALFDVFWRLMDDDAKRLIRDAKLVKWDGMEEVEVTTDDPVEKLKYIVSGADEITAIISSVFRANELSQPDPKETEKKSQRAAGR